MYQQQTKKSEHKVYTNNKIRSKKTKYVHQQQTKETQHKVCTNDELRSKNTKYVQMTN